MSRAHIVVILILGIVIRVRGCQAAPAASGNSGQGTLTPVVVEVEGTVEPTAATVELTSEIVPTTQPTATQLMPTPSTTATATVLPSATPIPILSPPPSPTCAPQPTPVTVEGVVSRRAMNMRAGPGTEFPILTMIYQDQRVSVVGRTEDSSWILILTSDGQQGWAWREFIEVESLEGVEISGLVLVTPTSAPS